MVITGHLLLYVRGRRNMSEPPQNSLRVFYIARGFVNIPGEFHLDSCHILYGKYTLIVNTLGPHSRN